MELLKRNENDIDQVDSILSKISVTDETYKMSLLSQLFPVWFGSGEEIRGFAGKRTGCMENFEVQSLFRRWI